jgi:hypothetical protein
MMLWPRPSALVSLVLLQCVILSCLVASATAEKQKPSATYMLQAERRPGQLTRVEAQLEVGGDLRFNNGEKIVTRPLAVKATLVYDEKQLAEDGQPRRAVRHYDQAEAVIQVDESGLKPRLRDQRRLIVAAQRDGRVVLFSPEGPLTRDELDLIDIAGGTLTLDQLLPAEPVALGDKWPQDEAAIEALLDLDAIARCEVESVLSDVKDGLAEVTLAGAVQGATEGVATELQIKARYYFHLKARRIVGLTLAIQEKREIGHVGPGLDVVAKLRLKIVPLDSSETLSDAALADVATDAVPARERLEHTAASDGFRFLCDRRWYVTGDERDLIVLRMVERGDLIAQCNISPVAPRSPERRISLAQYQIEVKHTLGDDFGRVLSVGQWTDQAGQLVYRVTVGGEVNGLPIEWRYYLIHHPDGRRVALAFTVEAELAERLGTSDRELVNSLVLSPRAKATAAKPTEEARR